MNKLQGYIALSMVMALVAAYFAVPSANAASLSEKSDTLSDSTESVVSDHQVDFRTPTGVESSTDTITVTFPAGFTMGSVAFGDMDLEIDEACDGTYEISKTLAATPGTSPTWGAALSGQVITLTAPTNAASGEIAADSCVRVEVGTNATGGTNQITNPNATGVGENFTISVGGTFGDTGDMLVHIFDSSITVSATVDETLSVSVVGVASVSCTVTGGASVIDTSGDANSVPFGTVASDDFYDACQSITVSTNSANGYNVTIEESAVLTSGSDTIPNGTCDGGTCTNTSEGAWATDTNNGFGYCMDDQTGDSVTTAGWTNQCGAGQTFKTIPISGGTPEPIMTSATEVSGDNALVGYRLSVDGAQAAGTYTNEIVYIATPTY